MTPMLVFPTLNNKFPCEGPKTVPVSCDFSTANTFDIDLKMLVQQAQISEVQSIFVDNSSNPNSVSIKVAVQNQTIVVPPYCQAYLAILASVAQLTVTSSSVSAVVGIFVQNFPVSNCVWNANTSGAQNVNVVNFPSRQLVAVDNNVSLAFTPTTTGANLAVGTTSASVAISPAAGQNVYLVNNGSVAINVRLGLGATTATTSDLVIPPNGVVILNGNQNNTLAAICSTGTSSLNYTIGNGGI